MPGLGLDLARKTFTATVKARAKSQRIALSIPLVLALFRAAVHRPGVWALLAGRS